MGLYTKGRKIDIAAISAKMQPVVEAWQNGTIQIIDPNITAGTYNVWTNKTTGRSHTELWTGSARIQPVRWPVLVSGSAEQVAYKSVRFQIPLSAKISNDLLVREGLRIRVTNGGMFPDMTKMLFVITAGASSSFAWNRTLDTTVDTGIDMGGS